MTRRDKLLERARRSPASLRFREAVTLAEQAGFSLARRRGSHHIFKHPRYRGVINLQEAKDGKAKAYQVRQLVAAIDALAGEDGC